MWKTVLEWHYDCKNAVNMFFSLFSFETLRWLTACHLSFNDIAGLEPLERALCQPKHQRTCSDSWFANRWTIAELHSVNPKQDLVPKKKEEELKPHTVPVTSPARKMTDGKAELSSPIHFCIGSVLPCPFSIQEHTSHSVQWLQSLRMQWRQFLHDGYRYICGNCGALVEIKVSDIIRCRECGCASSLKLESTRCQSTWKQAAWCSMQVSDTL